MSGLHPAALLATISPCRKRDGGRRLPGPGVQEPTMVQDPHWGSETADGHREILEACRALDAPGEARQRLRTAAQLFWKALRHSHTWPEILRSESAALIAKLFR